MKIEVSYYKDLEHAKNVSKNKIDEAAEQARSRSITPGSGQAMEYLEAMQEAKMKLQNPEIETPLLKATVEAELKNPLTQLPVADEIEAAHVSLGMYNQWISKGAEIRRVRLHYKEKIKEAATQAEVVNLRETAIKALNDL